MPKIREIIQSLEQVAPKPLQESYDNCGLQVGDANAEATGVLLCIDIIEATIDEAVAKGCNLIVAHHPLIFSGLKSITGKNYIERTLLKAIKNDVALYAGHTNFDAVPDGVNQIICDKLGVQNQKILAPVKQKLVKLVTFVPEAQAEEVRQAIFEAGAGVIGEYDCCSFNTAGNGTFRAGENTNPYVGAKGEIHTEAEIRIETIMPKYISGKVVAAMTKVHPYEEVAYDLYPLENAWDNAGSGMIGELTEAVDSELFLKKVKEVFCAGVLRHTEIVKSSIKKVAVCGGSGAFLIRNAIAAGADIFITGEIKYHDFFQAEDKIVLADIGHFESEQFTTHIFGNIILKNFSKFAVHYSEVNSNPLKYI